MKQTKLNFKDIKKVLSKAEMKKIMAGSTPCGTCSVMIDGEEVIFDCIISGSGACQCGANQQSC